MTIKESLGFVAIQISNLNSKRFLFCGLLEYLLYLLIIGKWITGEFGVSILLGVGAFWIQKDSDNPTSIYKPEINGELTIEPDKTVDKPNEANG